MESLTNVIEKESAGEKSVVDELRDERYRIAGYRGKVEGIEESYNNYYCTDQD